MTDALSSSSLRLSSSPRIEHKKIQADNKAVVNLTATPESKASKGCRNCCSDIHPAAKVVLLFAALLVVFLIIGVAANFLKDPYPGACATGAAALTLLGVVIQVCRQGRINSSSAELRRPVAGSLASNGPASSSLAPLRSATDGEDRSPLHSLSFSAPKPTEAAVNSPTPGAASDDKAS